MEQAVARDLPSQRLPGTAAPTMLIRRTQLSLRPVGPDPSSARPHPAPDVAPHARAPDRATPAPAPLTSEVDAL